MRRAISSRDLRATLHEILKVIKTALGFSQAVFSEKRLEKLVVEVLRAGVRRLALALELVLEASHDAPVYQLRYLPRVTLDGVRSTSDHGCGLALGL